MCFFPSLIHKGQERRDISFLAASQKFYIKKKWVERIIGYWWQFFLSWMKGCIWPSLFIKKLWYWTSHWPWLSLLSRHHCKFGPNQGVLNSHLSPGPYAYCSWFTHDGRSLTLSGTLNTPPPPPPSDSFCHIRLQSLSSLWTLNHISLRGS